jgi:hypothetical protein
MKDYYNIMKGLCLTTIDDPDSFWTITDIKNRFAVLVKDTTIYDSIHKGMKKNGEKYIHRFLCPLKGMDKYMYQHANARK